MERLGLDVDDKITGKIAETLEATFASKLEAQLPEKLGEQGVIVECIACTKAEQAEFFFHMMEVLDAPPGKAK